MDTVAIDRLDARYRLPASAAGQKERLDRILSSAVGDVLEAALERAGVPVHEEICIRSVHSVARLRLSAPDSTLATAWSLSLAEAIRRAVDRPGAEIVHYGSRHHALVDVVASVAAGDLRRAWAWRQIGLWAAGDTIGFEAATAEMMRALTAQPQAAVAALAAAARFGALSSLLARVTPSRWQALARAALIAAGAPPGLSAPDDTPPLTSRGLTQAAESIRRRSAIVHAVAAVPADLRDAAPARALAVLAILEVEPASVRRGGPFAASLVVSVQRALSERAALADAPVLEARPPDATASRDDRPAPEADGEPERALAGSVGADGWTPSPAASDDTRAREASALQGIKSRTQSPAAAEAPLPDVRRRATTGVGGLLFLVHIVSELGLPDEIADDPHLVDRPLRWVLHRLARALAAVGADDPGALAFAGLAPDAEPPSRDQEEASEGELAAVGGLRARVVAALRQRLERPADPEAMLLGEVCRRRAEIVADPGWLDVRLSLDEASTEVRRAGLDLDPGWLPWLGVVMRFAYA